MPIDKCWVGLEGVQVSGPIGVFESERLAGTQYLVDLHIALNQTHALDSDQLTDTIDYSILFKAIEASFAEPANLVEHVAGRILKALEIPLTGHQYRLKIRKLRPAIEGALLTNSKVYLTGTF